MNSLKDSGSSSGNATQLPAHMTASPFQPGDLLQQQQTEAGIPTSSFDVSAKPFIPPSGAISSSVNAMPFIPRSGAASGASSGPPITPGNPSRSLSGFSNSSVNAPPFVPSPPAAPARASSKLQQPPGSSSSALFGARAGTQEALPQHLSLSASPVHQRAMSLGNGEALQALQLAQPPMTAPGQQSLASVFGGQMGREDRHAGLPDGDDVLGMTAHGPLQVANMLESMGAAQGLLAPHLASLSLGAAQQRSAAAFAQQGALGNAGGQRMAKLPSEALVNQSRAPIPTAEPIYSMGAARGRGGRFMGEPGKGQIGQRGRGRGNRGRHGSQSGDRSGGGPGRAYLSSRFVNDRLRTELQQRSQLLQSQLNPETDAELGIPQKIHHYHSLYPLEDVSLVDDRPSMALGVRSFVLKGVSSLDGQAYVLRWIDGRQVILTPELLYTAHEIVDRWSVLGQHPHVLCPRQAVATKEVEDTASLVMVYDYHPAAASLEAVFMQPTATKSGLVRNACNEEQLWSFMVQLASALRAMHMAGLAARRGALAPSKVLLTSAGRLRMGALGLAEVLGDVTTGDRLQLQREDLTALGRLMLALACAGGAQMPSLEYCLSYFSVDFVTVLRHLLSSAEGGPLSNGKQLIAVLGERVAVEMETVHLQNEALINELSKECENGRLLRLLVKLGCINERPEGDMDSQWSETGDRYLLKLFRDFVFHQTSEDGAPVLDWGHMIEALNKLDAGVPEKILLLSRDEMSMLIVSYADIKRCAEGAYNELKTRAQKTRTVQGQQAMARKAPLQPQPQLSGGDQGGMYGIQ